MDIWMETAVWLLGWRCSEMPRHLRTVAALTGGLEHTAPAGSFPKKSSIMSEIAQCLQVGFFTPPAFSLAFAPLCGLLFSQNRFPGKKVFLWIHSEARVTSCLFI